MHRGQSRDGLGSRQQLAGSGRGDGEFTAEQLHHFREAFQMFDVNHTGRITTVDIFEVLNTMGNEVDPERERAIQEAVRTVDERGTGTLNLRQFIEFMKIMDEHNQVDAAAREEAGKQAELDLQMQHLTETAVFTYMGVFSVLMRNSPRKVENNVGSASRGFWTWLSALFTLYNVLHFVFISVLVAFEWRYDDQNPRRTADSSVHEYAEYMFYVRLANMVNIVHITMLFMDERRSQMLYEALQYKMYHPTFWNMIRFVLRPMFAVNMVASGMFLVGLPGLDVLSLSSIDAHLRVLSFSLAQFVTGFFLLSDYFYFDTFTVPANVFPEAFKIFAIDLFAFNWFRLVLHVFKFICVLVLLPFFLIFTIIFVLTGCCACGRGLFDVDTPGSRTNSFLRLVGFVSG